jgi:hypothetical protein
LTDKPSALICRACRCGLELDCTAWPTYMSANQTRTNAVPIRSYPSPEALFADLPLTYKYADQLSGERLWYPQKDLTERLGVPIPRETVSTEHHRHLERKNPGLKRVSRVEVVRRELRLDRQETYSEKLANLLYASLNRPVPLGKCAEYIYGKDTNQTRHNVRRSVGGIERNIRRDGLAYRIERGKSPNPSLTLFSTSWRAAPRRINQTSIDTARQHAKLITRQIDRDITDDLLERGAFEGKTIVEQRKIRRRVAKLANAYRRRRQEKNTFRCDGDGCHYDPARIAAGTGIDPDVHHIEPLAKGERRQHSVFGCPPPTPVTVIVDAGDRNVYDQRRDNDSRPARLCE